jgi:hypothetical protein
MGCLSSGITSQPLTLALHPELPKLLGVSQQHRNTPVPTFFGSIFGPAGGSGKRPTPALAGGYQMSDFDD